MELTAFNIVTIKLCLLSVITKNRKDIGVFVFFAAVLF